MTPGLLSAPRYCDQPFPGYRYVPGCNPHPTAHPAGHSYRSPGTPHPAVVWQPAERWRECGDYLFGCDLYNHGYWWEAHEAWEGVWRLCDRGSLQRGLLQGLIQVSAAHLQGSVQRQAGVERLRRSSAEHLRPVLEAVGAGRYMGLAPAIWWRDVERYFDRAAIGPADAAPYPYLLLK